MLKTRFLLWMVAVMMFGFAAVADEPKMEFMDLILKPNLETAHIGGVQMPSAEALKNMHGGQYILRAGQKRPVSYTHLRAHET